jgi:hypothetical protein
MKLRAPQALKRQGRKSRQSAWEADAGWEPAPQAGDHHFHEISRAAGPPKQTTKNDGLPHEA